MKNKITIVSTFKEGYAIARKEINQKFLYGYVNEELNGRAYVKKDDDFFFIDKYGNVAENERPKGLSLINNCKGEK